MGFSLSVTGPSPLVFRKLINNPLALFSEPYAGYLLFLFNDVDRDVERWFAENAVRLDGLTGEDVAFAVVAYRTHYRLHVGFSSAERRRQFECSADEAANHFQVDRLVRSGRFGFVNDGDEIVARNDGVYAIARDLRITQELPCMVAFDGLPSPEAPYAVFPLNDIGLRGLYERIRIVVGELQAHPGFDEYKSGLRSVHTIARKISEVEQRQVSEKQRSAIVHNALSDLAPALRIGAKRRFAAALRTATQVIEPNKHQSTGVCCVGMAARE